jgi:hypothetical protein
VGIDSVKQVFETSAEWPHMAAVERERRQRAAQAFELALRSSLSVRSMRQQGQGQGQGLGQRQGLQQAARQHSTGSSNADDGTFASTVAAVDRAVGGERRRVRIRSDPSRRTITCTSADSKDDEGIRAVLIFISILLPVRDYRQIIGFNPLHGIELPQTCLYSCL